MTTLIYQLLRFLLRPSADHLHCGVWFIVFVIGRELNKLKADLWIKSHCFGSGLEKHWDRWVLGICDVADLFDQKRSHSAALVFRENPNRRKEPREKVR